MTLFFVIDRSQWHFLAGLAINFCHWLQSMTNVHKFCVIDWSQWHMAISSENIGDLKLSLTSQWHFLNELFQNHQWQFPKVHIIAGSRWNLSLTSQWHFSIRLSKLSLTSQWQFLRVPIPTFLTQCKTVIDQSMTLFYWAFKTVIDSS